MNERYKKNFLHAGALAKETRDFGKSLIKKGASYNEVISKINKKIIDLGARAAFPPQIALDDVAAHYLPDPGVDIIFDSQVVKLDVGVSYDGAIGDTAVTIDLTGKHSNLLKAVESALIAAEESIKVGLRFGEVGKIIEETIASYGYTSVKNLCGHGLGIYQIHTPPTVPNCYDQSQAFVKPGMTFAIEPFATNGKGWVKEAGHATIFSVIKNRPMRSPLTRHLFEKIRRYDGLPFAIHDLMDCGLSLMEVKEGLLELQDSQIIAGYPPLIEDPGSFVAQAENSVLVDNDGKVFVTTR